MKSETKKKSAVISYIMLIVASFIGAGVATPTPDFLTTLIIFALGLCFAIPVGFALNRSKLEARSKFSRFSISLILGFSACLLSVFLIRLVTSFAS